MEKQTRTYTKPVRITHATLTAIKSVVREVQAKARASFSRANGLTVEQVEAIALGEDCLGKQPWECRTLATELYEISQPDYSVRFTDGSAVDSTDFDEMMAAMQSRSSSPERLTARAGRYSHCHIDLTISNTFFRSAEWDIRGDRADVRDIDRLLLDLLANSEPHHPTLHHRWRWPLIYIIATIAMHIGFVFSVSQLPLNSETRQFGYDLVPLFFIVALPTAYFIADRFENLFPLVEFSYGRSAKRRTDVRVFIFQVITVALIPVVLAALPALWTAKESKPVNSVKSPMQGR